MAVDTHIPWYREPKKLGAVIQIAMFAAVAIVVYVMAQNAQSNMDARGITMNTWFLDSEAPFKVGFSPFWDFRLGQTKYWEVFVIGVQNTLLVGIAGLIGATVLGFAVGVARLSENWFVKTFAAIFVEVFRNIPLLLQVFFWNFIVVLTALPTVKNSIDIGGAIIINKIGIFVPAVSTTAVWPVLVYLGAFVLALVAIVTFSGWAMRRYEETARTLPTLWISVVIFLGLVTVAFLIAAPATTVDFPEPTRFGFKGGFQIPIPLFSLWLALVCYTGAFIAENVRAGIQSVQKGQREAAAALGFHQPLSMKLVQIPQALRVIIPPTISQYLNLMKNSSLAVAIGYDDLVNLWMGVTLNQTGQAIVIIAMTMGVYTCISLLTSLTLNIYNKRTQLVER